MANNRLVAAASKVLLERNELDARDINLPSASLRRGLVHVAALRAPLLGALVTVLWLTMSSVALAQVGLPAPMVYYRFDDVNLGLDSGTLHHDGQVLASRTAGVRGGAIATGATDGVLEFHANAPELNLLGAASIIAWVKPAGPHVSDPSCHAGVVVSKGGNLTLAVAQDNDELWYENESSGDGIVAAEGSTPVGSWTQIAITRDTSGVVQFYRNGLAIGTPGPSSIGPTANGANLTIGYLSDSAPHACEFNGTIDEVQVFSGKLSETDVYVEYLRQVGLPAPMVYYRFDGANLGLDSGALHRDGQVLAAPTAGIRGGAIATGATDGVLEFHANAPELNLLGAASVIAWVKPAGPHISDPSCHAGVVASKGGNLTLAVAQDNNELWYENEASGDGIVAAEGSTPVGSWTQIAITRDASGLVQFYRNGRPTGIPGTSAIGPISNDANFTIGYQFDDIPHHCEFNGAIDEVQVFNGKLSAAEIYVEYLAVVPLSVPLWGFGARAATGVGLLLLGLAFARRRVLGHVIRS